MIQFKGLLVKQCQLDFHGDQLPDMEKVAFNFSYQPMFLPEESSQFGILFKLTLACEETFQIQLHALAEFSCNQVLTQEFISSHFPKINAPAIAFPYLRSFIANLMLNAGYPPLHLPSVNFVQLVEEEEARQKGGQKKPKRVDPGKAGKLSGKKVQ